MITVGDNKYAAFVDLTIVDIFIDSHDQDENADQVARPVIGIISVDNYDDVTGKFTRCRCFHQHIRGGFISEVY